MLRVLAVCALLVLVAGAPPLPAARGEGAGPEDTPEGPPPAVLALEDTLPTPRITLREVEVKARRMSLDDILDRIAAGEARRDSLLQDQVYDLYARVVARHPGRQDSVLTIMEQVSRIYQQRPDRMREVVVRRRGSKNVQVRADRGMSEQIIQFAFDPRLRRMYRFEILGRDIVGGHVIYRISFEPRSALYPLPSGRMWVNTNEFVIVREEFWYRGTSPSPLFFKSLDNCVVERVRVDGRYWVIGRILARASFTLPVAGIPPQGDLVMSLSNYRINRGIDPSVFTEEKGGKR